MFADVVRAIAMAWFLSIYPALAQPRLAAMDYVAPPSFEDPQLSPDGRQVAARTMIAGKARLALFEIGAGIATRPLGLPDAERLEWHRWIAPGGLLVSLADTGAGTNRLVTVDIAGDTLRQRYGLPEPA